MSEAMANLIFISVAIPALLFGLWICLCPLQAFEIQKKFYALINWRIEPISLEKEIRNTKLMGFFLIVVVVLASVYAWGH